MKDQKRISVVIPAFNEESSIGKVVRAIPSWVDEVIVADNGWTVEMQIKAARQGIRGPGC